MWVDIYKQLHKGNVWTAYVTCTQTRLKVLCETFIACLLRCNDTDVAFFFLLLFCFFNDLISDYPVDIFFLQ